MTGCEEGLRPTVDHRCLGAFDNIPFKTGGSGQEFLPLFALDAEFIERGQLPQTSSFSLYWR